MTPVGFRVDPAHRHAADDALYRKFERGRLDLRRDFVEVLPCERGGLVLEQVYVLIGAEGGARRFAVPGILEARLQVVGSGEPPSNLARKNASAIWCTTLPRTSEPLGGSGRGVAGCAIIKFCNERDPSDWGGCMKAQLLGGQKMEIGTETHSGVL